MDGKPGGAKLLLQELREGVVKERTIFMHRHMGWFVQGSKVRILKKDFDICGNFRLYFRRMIVADLVAYFQFVGDSRAFLIYPGVSASLRGRH